ncbi:MAG: chemotaxis protein CheW [Myxococcales bacterium]|nr:chemotaxis protein CheW [Myxococcales bacterium]
MHETHQICTFHLGDLFFGVEVEKVQEVLRYQQMTPVPIVSKVVRGLINLRGQIVTAIDLRRRFLLPDADEGQLPMNVVVRTGDGPVSLLVDEIGDVMEVDDDCIESPPATLRDVTRELVSSVYKLEGKLLLILDIDRAINTVGGESRHHATVN